MPKTTGFLARDLQDRLAEAVDLAHVADGSGRFVYTKRLYIYEAAYLLAFSAWEDFLEQVFLRFMCGYANSGGVVVKTSTWNPQTSISAAHIELLRIQRRAPTYLLWHNPQYSIDRSRQCFLNGPHETVISATRPDLEDMAAIRHHVAHRNEDTKMKFQSAARRLAGAGTVGGRAGRFLRAATSDPVTGNAVSWLERICADIGRYADQIAA